MKVAQQPQKLPNGSNQILAIISCKKIQQPPRSPGPGLYVAVAKKHAHSANESCKAGDPSICKWKEIFQPVLIIGSVV